MPSGVRPRTRSDAGVTERDARWAWGLLPQAGGVGLQTLLTAFGSARAAWNASLDEIQRAGIGPALAGRMQRFPWIQTLRAEQRRVAQAGVGVLVWGDPGYPARLQQVASAPPVLYLRGRLDPEDAQAVALVGSRRATAYGEGVARELAGELARRGLTIVSGLARGIDAAAHAGALEAGGRTLAVLGSGLDQIYPPEHRALAEAVAGSGALVSEFPLGTPPLRLHFPQRNRIISGLSLGVVVVEAGLGSGALITADHALEQGREVFAVPGRVHARYSEGCNRLIKAGAKLVESWEDVLSEFLPALKPSRRKPPAPPPGPLTPDERLVFEALGNGPRHIDAVIVATGLGGGPVASILVELEMRGVVRAVKGKVFELTDGS
jgi:DNA processing protein